MSVSKSMTIFAIVDKSTNVNLMGALEENSH